MSRRERELKRLLSSMVFIGWSSKNAKEKSFELKDVNLKSFSLKLLSWSPQTACGGTELTSKEYSGFIGRRYIYKRILEGNRTNPKEPEEQKPLSWC